MIILLAALTAAINGKPAPRVDHEVRVRATIIRGHEISSWTWNPSSHPAQREIVKKEKDGRTVLIRLTEFE